MSTHKVINHGDYAAGGHEERKEIKGIIHTLKVECDNRLHDCENGVQLLEELEKRIANHVEAQKGPGGLGRA